MVSKLNFGPAFCMCLVTTRAGALAAAGRAAWRVPAKNCLPCSASAVIITDTQSAGECMNDASALLGQLAEEFTAQVRAGKLPAIEDFARQHPNLAERIRGLFPTLLFLEGAAHANLPEGATAVYPPPALSLQPGQTFNQYRIEREIGRGGMGVVFEAVHLPLGPRVARQVLPLLPPAGAAARAPTRLERL